MVKGGVGTSPNRGKPGRRHSGAVYLPLLALAVVVYVASSRWQQAAQIPLASHERKLAGDGRRKHKPAHRSAAAAAASLEPPLVSSWAVQAERAAWHPPKYSTHTCIGNKFYDNWHMSTCKFDNLCINASTRQFEYYVDPSYSENAIDFDQHGNPLVEFPATLVNPGHARIDTSVSWRPVVKRSTFPRAGARVKWAPADQALVHAFPPPLLWNFGHVMFDVMVPIFNMQHQFGLYDPAAQILIPFAVNGTEADLRYWLPRLVNTKNTAKSVLHLTHDRQAAWVGEYASRVLGDDRDGLVCFKTVLAGTGYLSRQQADVDSLPYRQAVVRHLALPEPPQKDPVITILHKKGRRMVENSQEVQRLIAERYPAARVDLFEFARRPDMTIREQVRLMSDTSILISPCGGLATVLTFLRPRSTAIVLNYWNSLLDRSLQMEDNYYQHMEYLDFQYVPVTPQDYANTTDRPECELVEGGQRPEDAHYGLLGSLVHCNVRFQGDGLLRLLTYVDNAMLRWAARHGRYDVLDTPLLQRGHPAGGAAGPAAATATSRRRRVQED